MFFSNVGGRLPINVVGDVKMLIRLSEGFVFVSSAGLPSRVGDLTIQISRLCIRLKGNHCRLGRACSVHVGSGCAPHPQIS